MRGAGGVRDETRSGASVSALHRSHFRRRSCPAQQAAVSAVAARRTGDRASAQHTEPGFSNRLQEYYDKPGPRKFAPPGSLFGNCTAPLPSTGAPAVEALVAALRPAAPVLEQLELKAGGLPWAVGAEERVEIESVTCVAWRAVPAVRLRSCTHTCFIS